MSASAALTTDQIGTLAVGVIIGLIAIGVIVSLVMTKAIGRVILAVVVIGLGILVWTQRTSLEDSVNKCDANVSYFGIHVNLSAATQARCGTTAR